MNHDVNRATFAAPKPGDALAVAAGHDDRIDLSTASAMAGAEGGRTDDLMRVPGWLVYLASLLLTAVAVTFIMRLWRATWDAPFYNTGDAVASAAHFRTTMDTGWYEFTPKLGAPYGQHYHDFPFSDELHPAMARLLGVFTDDLGVAFNLYYILGFLLTALTATWFLRRSGLSPAITVTMSVLYAVAPYHFIRNENHLFLASYYCVPLALSLVLYAVSGRPLWGRRAHANRIVGVLTGRGAGTLLILIVVTLSAAYYAVFTGLLLAAAGLFAFFRDRRPARLGGVIVAGATLVGVLVAAMLPDVLYAAANGSDTGAFVRDPGATETYSLKFASLILPAPGHPIPAFNRVISLYNGTYPLPSEFPSLGSVAAIGFLILILVIPIAALASRRAPTPFAERMRQLSFLNYVAFLSATVGGLNTLVALFLTDSIRGWNRMSIFISLLSLAALGLVLDSAARYLRASRGPLGGIQTWVSTAVMAAVVLVLGVGDQSIASAIPNYQRSSDEWNSGEAFVRSLESSVPASSMIFQLPYMAFPESGAYNGVYDSDQLTLYLHNSNLRWSGGGIKGRPQSDWPAGVAAEEAGTMTSNLAAIGFQGIVIDRAALADRGAQLEGQLTPILGAPALVSPDQRYAYFSLQPAIDQVYATTTPEQREVVAAAITNVDPAG